jgi:hypothetical protein
MKLYIEEKDLPKNCSGCPLCHEEHHPDGDYIPFPSDYYCKLVDDDYYEQTVDCQIGLFGGDDKRPKNCPLLVIKSPPTQN